MTADVTILTLSLCYYLLLFVNICSAVLTDCFFLRGMTVIQGVPLATEHGIEDTVTKFEKEYIRCVRNEEECVCSVCL